MSKKDKKKKRDKNKLDKTGEQKSDKKRKKKLDKASKKKLKKADKKKREAFGKDFCPCCSKHCPLTKPKCGKGKRLAAKLSDT